MIRQPRNLTAVRAAWRVANDVVSRETSCFRMVAGPVPKLYVYDVIGGWDLDASEFVQAVHALDATEIDLHINSPGGLVWDAVSMYEALVSHPAAVHSHVDGLAGSAASFLALAGDTVDTAAASRWMIHDAQVVAIGSPDEVREMADLGDEVSNDIAGIYAARAGGKPAEWRSAMRATTWYSAQQSVDAGLADRVTGAANNESGQRNLAARTMRARATTALGRV